MVEKIWRKEVWRARLEFWKLYGLICKILGALVKRICNLEGVDGLKCKI
jgi:hypothetical protein